jgi:hypothetical protein
MDEFTMIVDRSELLDGCEIGDGAVSRAARLAQAQFLPVVDAKRARVPSKWVR